MYHKRKRIAIIHPMLSLGGASAVAVWTIEALKATYDVTLITIKRVNLAEFNNFFGSNIQENEITIKQVWRLSEVIPNGYLLKVHLAQRCYKQHLNEYDLAIATNCEMDLGKRGIQYIHIPVWNDEVVRQIGHLPNRRIHKKGVLRSIYKSGCMFLSGFSEQRMKQNITLVNSNWTGEKVKEVYGIESRTVYPPVLSDFPDVPWDKREEGFVCIGAIAPEKHIDMVVEIIKKIRRIEPRTHLHIIGNSPSHSYAQSTNRLCAENEDWLRWEQGLSRKQLTALVAQHKYGLHGMLNEHFGIAVAEMVKAGCIPFIPLGGGQAEIVKCNELIYKNIDDVVQKISYVVTDSAMQKVLREQLQKQSQQFSINTFIESIRNIIQDVI
jgi:glycosyltransferase involved in cell wall biosynthesis